MKWCASLHLCHIVLVKSNSQSSHTQRERIIQGCETGDGDHGTTLDIVHQSEFLEGCSSSLFSFFGNQPCKMADEMATAKVQAHWILILPLVMGLSCGFWPSKKFESFFCSLTLRKCIKKKTLTWSMKVKEKKEGMGYSDGLFNEKRKMKTMKIDKCWVKKLEVPGGFWWWERWSWLNSMRKNEYQCRKEKTWCNKIPYY